MEVDTAFKAPDVLISGFFGSIAHDHLLEEWISPAFHDMPICWRKTCKTYREIG